MMVEVVCGEGRGGRGDSGLWVQRQAVQQATVYPHLTDNCQYRPISHWRWLKSHCSPAPWVSERGTLERFRTAPCTGLYPRAGGTTPLHARERSSSGLGLIVAAVLAYNSWVFEAPESRRVDDTWHGLGIEAATLSVACLWLWSKNARCGVSGRQSSHASSMCQRPRDPSQSHFHREHEVKVASRAKTVVPVQG